MSLDYYQLGRTYPRTFLRQPFYGKRRRKRLVPVHASNSVAVSDTASSEDDALLILRNIFVTDTSSSADAISPLEVLVPINEYSSGKFGLIPYKLEVDATLSDTGSGTETFSRDKDFTLSETPSGTDTVVGSNELTVSDVGNSSTLPPVISADLSVTDLGAGKEKSIQFTNDLLLSDSSSTVDLMSVLLRAAAIADSGSGSDTISDISAVLPTLQDFGSSQEDPFGEDTKIEVFFTKLDASSSTDVIQQINVTTTVKDTSTSTEVSTFTFDMFVYESPTGVDIIVEVAHEDVREVLSLFRLASSSKAVIHTTKESSAVFEPTKEVKSIF